MLGSRVVAPLAWVILAFGLAQPAIGQDEDGDEAGIEFAPDEDGPAKAIPAATEPSGADTPTAEGEAQPEPKAQVVEDSLPKLRVRGKRDPNAIFGTYRVRVGMARPKFDDGLKLYEELYGDPNWYPTLSADWFAWDWYATLGLSFRAGYYTAGGHASKVVAGQDKTDIDDSNYEKDSNGPTTLTLLPLQVALTAEITPFQGKWLVLDGWIGYERLYWQEVRASSSVDDTASIRFATADDDDAEDDALTNKGWKNATVIGVSANILLNPVDEGAAASMRGSMGLGYIYLSPFMEIVRTTATDKKDKASFGRTSYGIGFTFESTH